MTRILLPVTHAEEIAGTSFGSEVTQSHYVTDRLVLEQAFNDLHGRRPSVKEAQIIQSIGMRESGWGRTWTGDGVGSNNIGCVHGTYNGEGFTQNDNDANGNPYSTSFRKYPSLYDGAKDFINEVTTRRPSAWASMKIGDYYGTAVAMHDNKPIYFEASIPVYVKGMIASGHSIANALNEKFVTVGWGWKDYAALGLTGVAVHSLWRLWKK